MPKLRLKATGALEDIPDSAVTDALATGLYEPPGADVQIPVVVDGYAGQVSGQDLGVYTRDLGARPETEAEFRARETAARIEREHGGALGGAAAFTEGALDAATFGGFGAVTDTIWGDDYTEARRERAEANPVASGLGTAAGLIAPAVASGGTGAAGALARATPAGMASRLGARIAEGGGVARAAAGYATEGALYGAGHVLSETILKDKELSAEAFLAGVGEGAAMGALGGIGFSLLGRGAKAAKRRVDSLAADRTIASLEVEQRAALKEAEKAQKAVERARIEAQRHANRLELEAARQKGRLEAIGARGEVASVGAEARVAVADKRAAADIAKAEAQAALAKAKAQEAAEALAVERAKYDRAKMVMDGRLQLSETYTAGWRGAGESREAVAATKLEAAEIGADAKLRTGLADALARSGRPDAGFAIEELIPAKLRTKAALESSKGEVLSQVAQLSASTDDLVRQADAILAANPGAFPELQALRDRAAQASPAANEWAAKQAGSKAFQEENLGALQAAGFSPPKMNVNPPSAAAGKPSATVQRETIEAGGDEFLLELVEAPAGTGSVGDAFSGRPVDPESNSTWVRLIKAKGGEPVLMDDAPFVVGEAQLIQNADGALYPKNVEVLPRYRRRGLASKMYSAAEARTGRRIVASRTQTPDGEGFSAAYRGARDAPRPFSPAPLPRRIGAEALETPYDHRPIEEWLAANMSHPLDEGAEDFLGLYQQREPGFMQAFLRGNSEELEKLAGDRGLAAAFARHARAEAGRPMTLPEAIELGDRAIASSRTPADLLTYRGGFDFRIDGEKATVARLGGKDARRVMKVGDVIDPDPGFQSTTPDLDSAIPYGGTVLQIQLPAGSPALYMRAHGVPRLSEGRNLRLNENELVLPRNTAYRVVGIEQGVETAMGKKNLVIVEPIFPAAPGPIPASPGKWSPDDLVDEVIEDVGAPRGFSLSAENQGRKLFDEEFVELAEGVPTHRALAMQLQGSKAYVVRPSELAEENLHGLMPVGNRAERIASIKKAWDDGTDLPAIEIDVSPTGKLGVADGNHRLLAAAETDRPVLVSFRAVDNDVIHEGPIADEVKAVLAKGAAADDAVGAAPAVTPDVPTAEPALPSLAAPEPGGPPSEFAEGLGVVRSIEEAHHDLAQAIRPHLDDVSGMSLDDALAGMDDAIGKQEEIVSDALARNAEAMTAGAQPPPAVPDAPRPTMPPMPGAAPTARPGAATSALGVLDLAASLGGLPNANDIPVVGPLLGTYLKYRAVAGALGKVGIRVGGPVARIARTAAGAQDRASSAVAMLVRGADKAAPIARRASTPLTTTLSQPLWDADDDERPAPRRAARPATPGRKDPQKLFEKRQEELLLATADPAETKREIAASLPAPPALASAIADAVMRKLDFLAGVMPQDPRPPTLRPTPYQYPLAELRRFADAIRAVSDPVGAVLEQAAHGSVTPVAAEALRTVFPRLYSQIQEELIEQVATSSKPIPYERRSNLALVFDVPLDGTMTPEYRSARQQEYAMAAQAAPPAGGPQLKLSAQEELGPVRRAMR